MCITWFSLPVSREMEFIQSWAPISQPYFTIIQLFEYFDTAFTVFLHLNLFSLPASLPLKYLLTYFLSIVLFRRSVSVYEILKSIQTRKTCSCNTEIWLVKYLQDSNVHMQFFFCVCSSFSNNQLIYKHYHVLKLM